MANPISSPLSLHSLSMEAILKNEIPTTHLSMLPTTLLEDILILKRCDVVVARLGPGTWSLDRGYILSLGREIGGVCWVEGSTIKNYLGPRQTELLIWEVNFEATGMDYNVIQRTGETELTVKAKYVKM